MSILGFIAQFLKLGTPQRTKVDGEKVMNLGCQCTVRVSVLLGLLSTSRLLFATACQQSFRNSQEELLHPHLQMQTINFKCATLSNLYIHRN